MDKNNIEVGAGNLSLQYNGDVDAVDVGGCSNAAFEVKKDTFDVDFDQLLDPVTSFNAGRELMFEIELKEDTMRNLVIAMGGNPSDIDTESDATKEIYEFPAASVEEAPFAELIYNVARVRNKTKFKTVILYRVQNNGGVKFKYEKKKERFYSIKFKAYADLDHGGKPGKIIYDKVA